MKRPRIGIDSAATLTTGLVLIGLLVYWPGVSGPFIFDDLTNILQDPSVAITSPTLENLAGFAISDDGDLRRRALARLTFVLNFLVAGERFDAFSFKLTNIIIHLVNGVLVFSLSNRLYARISPCRTAVGGLHESARLVPFFVALLWLAHPIQMTSVLYVVQRMTSLAALFVFLGLLGFVIGRTRFEDDHPRGLSLMLVGVVGGTALGGLCKETAILTPLLAATIEMAFFGRSGLSSGQRRRLLAFYLALIVMPVMVAGAAALLNPAFMADLYAIREYTLGQRLLSEARVLFFYLGLLLYPNVRHLGLFHDDFVASESLLVPWTTGLAVLGWIIVAGAMLWGLRRRAVWSFGVAWFLAGHLLESSILPLELVHEHRNYVPSFGIIFAIVVIAWRFLGERPGMSRLRLPIVGLVALVVAFATGSRATVWQDRLALTSAMVKDHPGSYRSQMALAFAQLEAGYDLATVYGAYRRATAMDPASVLSLVEMAKIVEVPAVSGAMSNRRSPDTTLGIDLLADELSLDAVWLDRARGLIHAEIERRLRDHAIVPTTTLSLLNLALCAYAGTKVCVALANANLRWHAIAIENGRVKDEELERLRVSREALARFVNALGEHGTS